MTDYKQMSPADLKVESPRVECVFCGWSGRKRELHLADFYDDWYGVEYRGYECPHCKCEIEIPVND